MKMRAGLVCFTDLLAARCYARGPCNRLGLASPSMGFRINSAGVLPHFAEDDPPVGAFERDRSVSQWIT